MPFQLQLRASKPALEHPIPNHFEIKEGFMTRRTLFILAVSTILAMAAAGQTSTWQIDPNHSSAQFAVRHMVVSTVRGTFNKVSGTAQYDPARPAASSMDATIDVASIDTRVDGRDKDLRSANFFDVEKYPTITFKSKRVDQAGPGKLKMVGDLTMHGVTKEVVLDVDGPTAPINDGRGQRVGVSATTKINRRDFGLQYNRVVEGSAVVGDEVNITLDVELVKHTS
jgi:polyisoprenoid-binding protein YceI